MEKYIKQRELYKLLIDFIESKDNHNLIKFNIDDLLFCYNTFNNTDYLRIILYAVIEVTKDKNMDVEEIKSFIKEINEFTENKQIFLFIDFDMKDMLYKVPNPKYQIALFIENAEDNLKSIIIRPNH